jgi:hypothetical protein
MSQYIWLDERIQLGRQIARIMKTTRGQQSR